MKAILYDHQGHWFGRVELPDTGAYPLAIVVIPTDHAAKERTFLMMPNSPTGRYLEATLPHPWRVPESAVETTRTAAVPSEDWSTGMGITLFDRVNGLVGTAEIDAKRAFPERVVARGSERTFARTGGPSTNQYREEAEAELVTLVPAV